VIDFVESSSAGWTAAGRTLTTSASWSGRILGTLSATLKGRGVCGLRAMSLAELMVDAWRQALVEDLPEVDLAGHKYKITHTRGQSLRVVSFLYENHIIEGIEQNPQKESRWAKLAQEGQRIMQFRINRRYIGNVCEGKLLRYPAWKSLGLPD